MSTTRRDRPAPPPKLGTIPLQALNAADSSARTPRPPGSGQGRGGALAEHARRAHVVAHSALQAAVLEGLVQRNVAKLVVGKPRRRADRQDVLTRTAGRADEARAFVTTAKAASPLRAASSRARARLRHAPERTGRPAVERPRPGERAREDRAATPQGRFDARLRPAEGQRAPRPSRSARGDGRPAPPASRRPGRGELRNGAAYHDKGLVFAKEPADRRRHDTLGDPLSGRAPRSRVQAAA